MSSGWLCTSVHTGNLRVWCESVSTCAHTCVRCVCPPVCVCVCIRERESTDYDSPNGVAALLITVPQTHTDTHTHTHTHTRAHLHTALAGWLPLSVHAYERRTHALRNLKQGKYSQIQKLFHLLVFFCDFRDLLDTGLQNHCFRLRQNGCHNKQHVTCVKLVP